MKVKDVLDELKVGDDLWVKATVNDFDSDLAPLEVTLPGGVMSWLNSSREVAFKAVGPVEVPKPMGDYLDQYKDRDYPPLAFVLSDFTITRYFEDYKDLPVSELPTEPWDFLVAQAVMYGYTVKQTGWVVVYHPFSNAESRYFAMDGNGFDITNSTWFVAKKHAWVFNDKEKAEALAKVLDGKVEEL